MSTILSKVMPAMKLSTCNDHPAKLDSRDWFMMEKKNGRGTLIAWDGKTAVMFNLSEGAVSWSGKAMEALHKALPAGKALPVLVGELECLPGKGFEDALVHLWTHQSSGTAMERYKDVQGWVTENDIVRVADMYTDPAEKQERYDYFYEKGMEGVVFYWNEGLYRPGVRSDHVQKGKFVENGDFLVEDWSVNLVDVNGYEHGTAKVMAARTLPDGNIEFYHIASPHIRQDVIKELRMYDNEGRGTAILQVQYLYATHTSLVQPISQEIRLDKEHEPVEMAVTNETQLRRSILFR